MIHLLTPQLPDNYMNECFSFS